MKPGDLLYLPRGQYHDALTGSQASLHVTFGVSPATGLAVFKLLESVLASDSAFRAYLPDARDGAALGDRLSALAEKISAQLVSPVFAIDVHNHQRGLRSPSVDYDLPVQKKSVWFAVAKSAPVVRRQQGYVLSVEREEIELGHLAPTIEWALKQRSFSLEDAAARQSGVDMAALRSILERLIGAGVIVETAMQ